MYKKQLNIKDIQACSLEILQAVHTFCVRNGLKYSLAYGTLIGAIRHKGFIPWDDDIDIIMPRPDYERFVRSFSAPGLGIISEKDEDYYLNYCRVFDTVKTSCETLLPVGKNYNGGVWIDVFPADGVSDDVLVFERNILSFKRIWILQLRYRLSMAPLNDIFRNCSLKEVCILIAIKISMLGRRLLRTINTRIRNNAVKIAYGSTEHWSQLEVLDDGVRNYQLCDDFNDTIDAEFEGHKFKIMKGYDRVLRNIYGDYMQLPPEEQRQPKHSHVKLYWK